MYEGEDVWVVRWQGWVCGRGGWDDGSRACNVSYVSYVSYDRKFPSGWLRRAAKIDTHAHHSYVSFSEFQVWQATTNSDCISAGQTVMCTEPTRGCAPLAQGLSKVCST